METCRACLSTGMKMIPMDEFFLQNYNMLTGLNVRFSEGIPVFTCKDCLDGTTFCIEFRKKCIASDLAWKKVIIHKKEPIDNLALDVECEVPIELLDAALSISKEENIEYQYIDDSDCFEYSYDELLHESRKCKIEVMRKPTRKSVRCKTSVVKLEKENDKKKDICCGLCVLKFEDKASLCEHLEKHKKDTECERCHETYTNLPHLLGHRLEHVPDKQKFCHICDKKFLTAPGLEFHYMRKHEMAKKDEPIACKKCPRTFTQKRALLHHISTSHSGYFECEHCGKGFGAKYNLQKHIMSIHSKVVYKCDLCNYTCRFFGGLNVHKMKKHTVSRVYCEICKRGYGSKARLDKHVCKKKRKSKHMCPICGRYISGDITSLTLHMMIHDEVPRFKCEQCSATFKTKKPFILHMDKHAGKPRHECKYCQRKFYSANVLTKHKRVHTGEKPYVCKICDKGFTANHNLKVHMKVHGITNLINRKEKPENSVLSV